MNTLKILSFFFENPGAEVHLRELARRTKTSPQTALRSIEELANEGLVVIERKFHITSIRTKNGIYFKALKAAYTISKFENAKITEIFGKNSLGLSSLLLYGSTAAGEDTEESDYDLLAIANRCNVTALDLSRKLGKETNLKVMNIIEWKETSKTNRAFYLEVISKSIVLFGNKPILD